MGSVVGKRINGRTYYYFVESARVDGRPRIVAQRYLGSAEEIAAAVDGGGGMPESTRQLTFGDSAAVWGTLERLQVAPAIDEIVGRRKVSVGRYLALAVLQRAVAPCATLADWWAETAAERFIRPRFAAETVRDEQFWQVTRRLTRTQLERIEEEVVSHIRLDAPVTLAVDIPNFATYAESDTADAALAGLSAVVTRDGAIPLVSHVYQRGVPFGVAASRLAARHRGEVTVVFDAGQQAQLDLDAGRHFVGALPLADFPELLVRPASVRRPVDPDRFAGLTALDTHATVSGVRRRVVLTHSARLHAAQVRGFAQALSTATRQLDGLALALEAGTNRRTREQLLTELARITRVRWVDRVLTARLTGGKPGELRLEYRIDEAARARLDEELFGKQLLVTDHDDWSVLDVITAYRARYHLDSTFRMFHGSFVAAPAPRWDWTEQRIAVHSLVSTLAAAVTHLMRQEADRAGLDLSVRELLEQLSRIGETVLRYPSTGGRPRTRRVLTSLSGSQRQLFELFNLEAYAP
ncbi:transposase [Amycolatopsis acidicola]|uniref:Transposase n=1 Tax=Amycolatopsis acidicola TaxID=2596893 RepID=A0A5N0V7C4_9PSEU|nr:transposase [Amycolatopsis acidicola]KAA9161358.1 transposase [Amycolatopsis acidicola]